MFLRGSSTVGIAKILAGCRLQTYYPITPASDESEYLEEHENIDLDRPLWRARRRRSKGSIAVVQTEDEIAAITDGGGRRPHRRQGLDVHLRPRVLADGRGDGMGGDQRGPGRRHALPEGRPQHRAADEARAGRPEVRPAHRATGSSRGSSSPAETSRSPSTTSTKAFNFAERYQVPVIHIVDKAMANSDQTYPMFDPSLVKIEQGRAHQGRHHEATRTRSSTGSSGRESGISPRPAIGTKGGIYWNTGDEHDEKGHISEDPTNRDDDDGEEDGEARPRGDGDTPGGEGPLLRPQGRPGHPRELGLDQGGDPRRDGGPEGATAYP